jgi:hypothetical protein
MIKIQMTKKGKTEIRSLVFVLDIGKFGFRIFSMLYALCSMPLQIYNLQSDPNQRVFLFLNRNPTVVQKLFKTQGGNYGHIRTDNHVS